MHAWEAPLVPQLPNPAGHAVLIHDSSTKQLEISAPEQTASLYACGITPYDATHIGHANTYVTFDLLNRAWLDAGKQLNFAQNITDVDDPLLERATATGVDWRDLAASQIELFRSDMKALRVIPPQHWITVTEAMPEIIETVTGLVKQGASYFDPNDDVYNDDSHDVYFDIATDPFFGAVSNLRHDEMLTRFVGHGGDPERPGKHNALDPILWRAHRPGEPEWDGGLIGIGRSGWHIGCAVIAHRALGATFDVTGGGRDLLFPHHEMSASLARVLYGTDSDSAGAKRFMHCGLISYQGEKMSKSLGNLVLVSQLRAAGVDPMAIRLTLLSHHYRSDWEWTDQELANAIEKLNYWRSELGPAVSSSAESLSPMVERVISAVESTETPGDTAVTAIRAALANDLNAPAAVEIVDEYLVSVNRSPAGDKLVSQAVDALLGIAI